MPKEKPTGLRKALIKALGASIVLRASWLNVAVGHLSDVERGRVRAGRRLRESMSKVEGLTTARVHSLCAAAERTWNEAHS